MWDGRLFAGLTDPRSMGKASGGPLAGLWRSGVGGSRVVCDMQTGTLRILVYGSEAGIKVYR